MISIVVPCFNEALNLEKFLEVTHSVMVDIPETYEIIFVNDGSKDDTLKIIRKMSELHDFVRYISFSRNFGKESAMFAGFKEAEGELVVVMDADLQHPPYLLKTMYEYICNEGYDVVATRRTSRKGEPPVRSFFASQFYKLVNRMSEVNIVEGAQDFRMMRRSVLDSVLSVSEYHRFSKGIFTWVGYDIKYIEVENVERFAGQSTWSFFSLFKYAMEGIIAFSTTPLRFTTFFGFLVSFAAFIYSAQIFIQSLFFGVKTAGYPSMMIVILFLGGIQLIALGIIGEYIARTYVQSKQRPHYFIKERNPTK